MATAIQLTLERHWVPSSVDKADYVSDLIH